MWLAARMAGILLLFIAIAVWLERKSRSDGRYHNPSALKRSLSPQRLHGLSALLPTLLCIVPFALGFIIPAGLLLYWSISFAGYWSDELTWKATFNSVSVGLITSFITILLSLWFASLLRNKSDSGIHMPVKLSSYGYAVPGTIIAVGILIPLLWLDKHLAVLWSTLSDSPARLILTGSIFGIIFACTIRFLGLGLNMVDASMQTVTPAMDNAARSLGCSHRETLQRVLFPIIRNGTFMAALVVFIDTVKELPATYMLRPFNFDTLAIRVFELAGDEQVYASAPPALLLMAISILPVCLLARENTAKRLF
jgi:iron(III) transport system permease protein